MAAEFQGQFQEAMREAEMADLKKTFDEVKEAATGFTDGNVMTSLQKDVGDALRIDDIDKPAVSATDTPAIPATETPAIEPPVMPTTPEISKIETPEISKIETPEISKIETPEPPIPETFTEADAHAAAMEPLAITREVQSQPAPQDITPAAPDILKDAKAS
jgi:sec-independent protein translocase protein TatB